MLLGERLSQYIPLAMMRFIAAALFAVLGVLTLLRFDLGLGFSRAAAGVQAIQRPQFEPPQLARIPNVEKRWLNRIG